MTVVTRRPAGPLGELVTAVTYRAGEQPRRSVEKILPGPETGLWVNLNRDAFRSFGSPGGGRQVPGAMVLRDDLVPLPELWGRTGACLRERLLEAATPAATRGVAVGEVADQLGLLPRTLRRRFSTQVGLTPKWVRRPAASGRRVPRARRGHADRVPAVAGQRSQPSEGFRGVMYAHKITGFTGPGDVVWEPASEPAPETGVLVDVVAAGVSFADLLQTRGQYQMKVPVPYVPGMDAAGVVRSGLSGSGLSAGQRVVVLASSGCWQEVVSAPAERVLPLPDGMGFEAGVAACLNYLTVLFALVRRGQAAAGETLLVHGAAGGVGIAAIQLGRALGLRTVAVAGDEAKRDFALRCGADHAVLADGWLGAVRGLLGERSVDIVLDPVGSDRMTDSLRSLAPLGRLLVVGFAGGEIPVVKVNRLLLGNTGVLGVAFREFFEARPEVVGELWSSLTGLRRDGRLGDPPVMAFPFADARGALGVIADRKARGKVVLSRQVSE